MTEIAESAKGPAGPGGRRPRGWQLSAESPLWMFASSTRIKPKPAHIGGDARIVVASVGYGAHARREPMSVVLRRLPARVWRVFRLVRPGPGRQVRVDALSCGRQAQPCA